jgi:precorrin-6x reductase
MPVDQRAARVYPSIGATHPFAAEMTRLRAQVAADPCSPGASARPS